MTSKTSSLVRFLVAVVLMGSAALFLHARSRPETSVARKSVNEFPSTIAGWIGRDVPISQDVRDILGPGDFLSRIYYRPGGAYVDFFVAYFSSQRTGNSIHSPKNCLPGSGWSPTDSREVQITRPDGSRVWVNRYIISKGMDRQLVLYWYQAHSRIVASEYWAKYFLVADAITMNRSDGSLVRVITPLTSKDTVEDAQKRATEFAQVALANLDPFIPR